MAKKPRKKKVQHCTEGAKQDRCEMCGRTKPLTKHHLIPRAVHTKKKFVTLFGKKEMRTRGLMVCKLCHHGIHDLIPKETDLAEHYNTKELLMAHAAVQKHVAWVKKQK